MSDASYTEDLAPSYVRVARQIHEMLSQMKVNDRLMSERLLSAKLGVSRMTLRRSLHYFQSKGILVTRPGGGTILAREVQPLVDARKDTKLLGLLVETIESALIARIVNGVEKCVSDHGYHLALAHNYGDMNHQIAQIDRLKGSGVRGVAVFPNSHWGVNQAAFLVALDNLLKSGIHLVLIDRYVPGVAAPCVLSDNFRGSYMATEHLILSGRRHLGLLGFGPYDEGERKVVGAPQRDRRKGFIAALEDHGLAPEPVVEAELGTHDYEESSQLAVEAWIKEYQGKLPFDGLVCMQDNMAYGAYLALKAAGIAVPGQVALIGYDNGNREIYQAAGLHLSSVDQPAELIGQRAAELLFDQIEGKEEARQRHLLLKPSLVIRTSCGGPLSESAQAKKK